MRDFLSELAAGFVYLWRVWVLGWKMIGKTLLAYLIVSLFFAPLAVLGEFAKNSAFLLEDSAASIAVRVGLLAFMVLIYLPLVFYVAASWVGFCPRIGGTQDGRRGGPQPTGRLAMPDSSAAH